MITQQGLNAFDALAHKRIDELEKKLRRLVAAVAKQKSRPRKRVRQPAR
jgi:hypothetical protein